MNKVFIINKKQVTLVVAAAIIVILGLFYLNSEPSEHIPAAAADLTNERTIHMVTGEFKATTPEGETIEAYRWDPGTIPVQKGENVKLSIYGVNGESHPFIIEGLDIKGEVRKGEETIVSFKAEKEGIYRIICLTHPDIAHNGPMIGYIVVQ